MNLKKIISIALIAILAFASVNAKIATWDISPKYEKLTRFFNSIFLFKQNGKWGLVQSGNREIIPAICDGITPFINGYSLACVRIGNRYLLKYIIGEDGSAIALSDKYYLHDKDNLRYVSEGKLAVADNNGKYGYISADGRTIIKCQFEDALPFKEGWASVKLGNYSKYITDNYDNRDLRRVLIVDFNNGEMTLASCFQNGVAIVAYNKKYAMIGMEGQVIRKLNETLGWQQYNNYNNPPTATTKGFNESSQYSIITQNEKYGLKDGETIAVIPQFDIFSKQFNDGTIVTMCNGRYGLLKISEGDITATTLSTELEVDRDGNISSATIDYCFPNSLSSPKMLLDLGDGIYKSYSPQLSRNGANASLTITPIVPKNAESCTIKGIVENDGIKLADFEKSFTLNYPIKLRVSAPGPDSIRANAKDWATFGSIIYNDSNKQVRVKATWSTGEKEDITIPAHGSKYVEDSIKVYENFTKTISIVLSTGESASRKIYFQKYF